MDEEMKKIKLLYLVSSLKKCGPINILSGLINGLDKNRFDISIIALSKEKKGSLAVHFQDPDIRIDNLNNSRIKGALKNLKEVQAYIDAYGIDICHSNDFRADHINSKLKRVITTNTIHNFPKEDYIYRYGKLSGQLMEVTHKKTIGKISCPIACSKTIRDKFLKKYKLKTDFIQNGVNTKAYYEQPESKPVLKKKLHLPVDKKIFIVSGGLTTLKNPRIIIDAFNAINDTSMFLVFIGKGNLLDSLVKENKNKNIIFKGRVDHVNMYLNASDYYISASLTEGLPNSVLEAMSSGLPCLLSNISAHEEIVGKSYPYLFDPNEADQLVEKIQSVMETDNKEICQQLKRKINDNFSAEKMSKQYQDVYLNLIKKSGRLNDD